MTFKDRIQLKLWDANFHIQKTYISLKTYFEFQEKKSKTMIMAAFILLSLLSVSMTAIPEKNYMIQLPDTDLSLMYGITEKFVLAEKIQEIPKIETPDTIEQYRKNMPRWFIETVILVESEGNHNAVSYAGFEYGAGLMQVSQVAVIEYNKFHGTNWTQWQVYTDKDLNIKVGCWLLNHYYELLDYPAFDDLYMAFNVGIGNYINYYHNYKSGYNSTWQPYSSMIRYYNKEIEVLSKMLS
jgi:soluble lytic murein transglycosylase-like protein